MLKIEPGDDIQVWVKGGYPLWGNVAPVTHPEGAIVMTINTEPLPDTREACIRAGVLVDGKTPRRSQLLTRGAMVTIPKDVIDTIFGDARHDEDDAEDNEDQS
jgi:hypothetical protein